MKYILLLIALALSACASVEPDAVRLEAAHQSSIGQHLQGGPVDYGMNTVGVTAVWRRGHWIGEVSEAYAVQGIDACVYCKSRDVFNARVGYEFQLK